MGSDLYRVKVAEKQERTVSLMVEVVHPDANHLSDNPSFALMLLHEGACDAKDAPLNEEISFEDTMDRDWLSLYTKGFIEQVDVSILSGSPDGDSPEDWLKGTVTITVTDPAWVAHLEVGAEFDSRAFEAAFSFQDCPPIRPGQVDPDAPVPEAFVAVPGALFDVKDAPAVVGAAAYSPSAYRPVEPREGKLKADELRDLDGRVVVYKGKWDDSPRTGFLHISGSQISLLTVSSGSHGSSSTTTFEGSIGLAELIPGKRLGSKLKVSQLISRIEPRIQGVSVEGDSATFTIAVPPGNTSLDHLEGDQLPAAGFLLLTSPLGTDSSSAARLFKPSPLSWTIEREVVRLFDPQERQISKYINGEMVPAGDTLPQDWALATRLAKGFVKQAEVVSKPTSAAPDLDALAEPDQREALSKPWPELVIKVTPHHAAYLEHLAGPFEPRKLPSIGQAQPWEGEIPEPATESTGFGQPDEPTEEAPAASRAASGQAGGDEGGLNKVLIIGGVAALIVLIVLVFGFFLCCCLPLGLA